MKAKIKHAIFLIILASTLFVPQISNASFLVCGDRSGSTGEMSAAQNIATIDPKLSVADQQKQYNANLKNFQNNSCKLSDLFKLAALVTNFLIGAVGIVAVVRITIAGIQMVAGSGTGNESLIKEAKQALEYAILGLVIVMISFVIVNTVFSIFAVKIGAQKQYSFPYNPLQ